MRRSFYVVWMKAGLDVHAVLARAGVHPFDGAVALAVGVCSAIEVLLTPDVRVPGVLGAAVVLMSLSLAWRRRFPLGALLLTAGVFVAKSLLGSPPAATVMPNLTLLLAAYAVAAYAPLRLAAAGVGALIAAIWVSLLPHPPLAFSDFAYPVVGVLGPWLAGLVVRRRSGEAARLARRTVELELEREERAKAAVAAERRRIARELHDVIAHSVSVMIVQAGAAERVVHHDVERATQSMAAVQATGREALGELGRLLGFLAAQGEELCLAPQPTLRELDPLVNQIREAGLQVDVRREGNDRALSPGVDLAAYRIVQEGLTNVLKHAHADRAEVVLRYGTEFLQLEIIDDGRANGSGQGSGRGLVGMRERVALYGGDLETGVLPGGGYAIRARLPLEDSAP